MSSQRTAQYHWGTPLQAPTQQDQQTCAPLCSAASQAQLPGSKQEAGSSTARCDSRAGQRGDGQQVVPSIMIQQQQQLHRKAAFADQEKQHLPPTTYGVSFVQVSLCHQYILLKGCCCLSCLLCLTLAGLCLLANLVVLSRGVAWPEFSVVVADERIRYCTDTRTTVRVGQHGSWVSKSSAEKSNSGECTRERGNK